MQRVKALQIYNILKTEYPDLPKSFLEFGDPYQLLIAVILSAQCTDRMVNTVTPKLFAAYPDARALAAGDLEDIMTIIKPTGFFQNKARSIKNCARDLVEKFGSKVPCTVEELVTLPGVGRKTANVVTQIAFDRTEGVVIDTHVKRLSNRIGFSKHDDVDKIELDLMELFPKETWKPLTFYMIMHGRAVCDARRPDCDHCVICSYCEYFAANRGALSAPASVKRGRKAPAAKASKIIASKKNSAKNPSPASKKTAKPAAPKKKPAAKKAGR